MLTWTNSVILLDSLPGCFLFYYIFVSLRSHSGLTAPGTSCVYWWSVLKHLQTVCFGESNQCSGVLKCCKSHGQCTKITNGPEKQETNSFSPWDDCCYTLPGGYNRCSSQTAKMAQLRSSHIPQPFLLICITHTYHSPWLYTPNAVEPNRELKWSETLQYLLRRDQNNLLTHIKLF